MKSLLGRLFVLFGFALASAAANAVVTLTATPASVAPGGTETAAWSGIPSPTSGNWIGLYTPAAGHGSYISYRYTTGTASGSVPFTIPSSVAPGTYQLRLFASNINTLLATSNNFAVSITVSGTVTLGGSPLAGVSFAATNGGTCTPSNASGQYSCAIPQPWTGTVTPSLSGYFFTPASRSYSNVTTSQAAQNYTAVVAFQVSGRVTAVGASLPGVAFAASSPGVCTSSNASGQYSCSVPQGWSGSVTPTLGSYVFTPASRSYSNVQANQGTQDYATVTVQVSGTATVGALPLGGVVFAASSFGSCSSSNPSGQYTCTVPQNWSGSVTPSLANYSFTPPSRSHTSVASNLPGQDFAATAGGGATAIYYIHVDHLNTPRLVADATGTTVWRWDQTEPFGNNPADENPSGLGVFDLPLRLPGQYFDKETNLHYNYFRDYDPSLGGFVQSDPLGLLGGLNTFAYASGAPLSYVDREGLKPVGTWIRTPFPHLTGLSNYAVDPITPRADIYGFLMFLRISATASGYINIDVACTDDQKCGPTTEQEVHTAIPLAYRGHFDWGPNGYAILVGMKFGGKAALLTTLISGAIKGGMGIAEIKRKYGAYAAIAIAEVLAHGPDKICQGNMPVIGAMSD